MKPLALDGDVTLTARPGLRPESQITGLSAAILPPIPLPANEQFEWKLTLDGQTRDEWHIAFVDGPAPATSGRLGALPAADQPHRRVGCKK